MPDKLGDKIRIQHILDAISEIESYTKNVEIEEFSTNSMMLNATLRQLEIIGEASNRLSESFKQRYQHIYWKKIIGLRNLVIHEYFGVDIRMIWNIVQNDLPVLKDDINDIHENLR